MSPQRNTAAIAQLAAEKSQKARQRVAEAIRLLQQEGQRVNFNTVSQRANVSKTFLYDPKHADLAEKIRRLRSKPVPQSFSAPVPPASKSTTAKDAQLVRLRERLKQAEEELRGLRRENEMLWGRLADEDPF